MRFLCLFFFLSPYVLTAQTTAVYVSAHQDDWQLFMNPNAYRSIQNPNTKTIILHTTAGDAGAGMGNNAYFLAREKGSLAAVQFLSKINRQEVTGIGEMTQENIRLNGKIILRYSLGNTHVYCLRLPDGNGNGVGYPIHMHKSLEKLYKEKIKRLHNIDSTATYENVSDLKKTLKALIDYEHQAGELEIHLADTETVDNPNDHSDHQTSSKIVQDVVKNREATLYLYKNYTTGDLPNNVFKEDELLCAATWGVTTACLAKNGHYSTWDSVHNSWIGKQYFKKITLKKNF